MRVIKAHNQDDIERLKPVALEWKETCNGETLGINLAPETYYADLANLLHKPNAALFMLLNDAKNVVGYIGVECFNSPLGNQKIAQEHYWYVSESHRPHGSMQLIRIIREWAKKKGCSHLIMNTSTLASDKHDKLCSFYERLGMKKFETSFIKEIV